ncbi:ferrous iron transport protein A [Clostridiaceae bacterium NSJ-31]|uniref:Ferrous iron transport protein A n=1 Tax=Ligaoa zhengdingensis TaxID=2763658 RepID=A0A926DYX8_9FIRM|nr:FeoA family protein [Ligaoa zhengdingensis]MBC8546014.1 ferrous iron transport protein A [Ligaoa zhengdingensis]
MSKKQHSLRDLHPGQSGRIIAIEGTGALKRRLIDMGLTPGCDVFVRKVAPLGDPIEINIRGYELSLRKDDAEKILLEN